MGYNAVVKVDVHENAKLVASCHADETVEGIYMATPGLLLMLTLQGTGTISRAKKADSDWQSALWLAQCLAEERVLWKQDLSHLITATHRQNWVKNLPPFEYCTLIKKLRDIGYVVEESPEKYE